MLNSIPTGSNRQCRARMCTGAGVGRLHLCTRRPSRRRGRWVQSFRVALSSLMVISQAVVAQTMPSIPMPALAWPGLPQDDLDRMHAAASRLYEGRSIGTVERWRSSDTKDAGEVELIRSFDTHGMPCRTISYRIRYESNRSRLYHYMVNWCRVPSGEWKIVEIGGR